MESSMGATRRAQPSVTASGPRPGRVPDAAARDRALRARGRRGGLPPHRHRPVLPQRGGGGPGRARGDGRRRGPRGPVRHHQARDLRVPGGQARHRELPEGPGPGLDRLMLIHWPHGDDARTWRALEEACSAGRLRSIGLSNFYGRQVEEIVRAAEFLPVVDQVETHVLYQQRRLARVLDPHGIRVEASPLGAGDPVPLAHPVLVRIARDHGAAPAQVDLRIKSLVNVSVIDISASYLTPHPDAQARRAALAGPGRAALPGPRLAVAGDVGHGLPITLSDDNPMGEFGALYWCEAGHHHSPTTQLAAVPDLSFILPRADASRTDRDAGAHRGGQAGRGPTAVRSDPREADHHQAPRRGTRRRSRGPLPPHRSHPLRRDRLLPGPAPEAVVPAKPAPVRRIRRQSWLRTRGGRCCGRPRMPSGPCPGCPGAAGGYPPPWVRRVRRQVAHGREAIRRDGRRLSLEFQRSSQIAKID